MSVRVVIPIAGRDFDPTEVAVPWQILRAAGHRVSFATPDGERGRADELMLSGEGLDPWGFVPGLRKLVAVGAVLRAGRAARDAYAALERDSAFLAPMRYDDLRGEDFDALVLPGGHRAAGMRPYLESTVLQAFVAAMGRRGQAVRGDLPRRRRRRAGAVAAHRTLRAVWAHDDVADVAPGAARVVARARRAFLGSAVLSDVRRTRG